MVHLKFDALKLKLNHDDMVIIKVKNYLNKEELKEILINTKKELKKTIENCYGFETPVIIVDENIEVSKTDLAKLKKHKKIIDELIEIMENQKKYKQ